MSDEIMLRIYQNALLIACITLCVICNNASANLNQNTIINLTTPIQVKYYQRTVKNKLTADEDYWIGLLKLALDKSGHPYNIKPVIEKNMSHARLINSLSNNGPVNIAFMGTNKHTEQKLLAIYIPVFRGLMGYRVMMTTQDSMRYFANVSDVTQLKNVNFGLGFDWADEPIMKDANLTVITAPYDDLFKMLAGGRFDAISRAAHEIKAEHDIVVKSHPKLTIEPNLIFAYRLPSFFFVGPNNSKLAKVITLGLENAYKDGSFLTYFKNHPVIISALNLINQPNRKWINLQNNHLSDKVNNINSLYWLK
jgi:hypothetical protein